MAVKTFTMRESVVTVTPSGGAAIVLGVFQGGNLTIDEDLVEVFTSGAWLPSDLKEDTEHISGSLKKGMVNADLWDRILRNANGYLTDFSVEFKLVDGSGSTPFPNIKHMLTGCKSERLNVPLPKPGSKEILIEEISFKGTGWSRATGTQATFPNPLT